MGGDKWQQGLIPEAQGSPKASLGTRMISGHVLEHIWGPGKFRGHWGLVGTSEGTCEKEIQFRMGLSCPAGFGLVHGHLEGTSRS